MHCAAWMYAAANGSYQLPPLTACHAHKNNTAQASKQNNNLFNTAAQRRNANLPLVTKTHNRWLYCFKCLVLFVYISFCSLFTFNSLSAADNACHLSFFSSFSSNLPRAFNDWTLFYPQLTTRAGLHTHTEMQRSTGEGGVDQPLLVGTQRN